MAQDTKNVATLVLYKGKNFIMQRRDSKAPVAPNKLSLFGGHIQKGEDPADAALRELKEETSLDVENIPVLPLAIIEGFWREERDDVIDAYIYTAEINDINFKVYEGKNLEVIAFDEILDRDDVSPSSRAILETFLMESK